MHTLTLTLTHESTRAVLTETYGRPSNERASKQASNRANTRAGARHLPSRRAPGDAAREARQVLPGARKLLVAVLRDPARGTC